MISFKSGATHGLSLLCSLIDLHKKKQFSPVLKFLCNEKIVDPILSTTKQHLQISLNCVFSFLIPCFVLEILGGFLNMQIRRL